ncbi:MAG: hypothetical protein PQJ60_13215, partial [Spirochaetales bacterium]|nr:hypothetical protein [Spirochaetales bacterium]
MNKKVITLLFSALALAALFSSCTTTNGSSKAANGSEDFHINRYYQSEALAKGAAIGIINTSPDSSAFLA